MSEEERKEKAIEALNKAKIRLVRDEDYGIHYIGICAALALTACAWEEIDESLAKSEIRSMMMWIENLVYPIITCFHLHLLVTN